MVQNNRTEDILSGTSLSDNVVTSQCGPETINAQPEPTWLTLRTAGAMRASHRISHPSSGTFIGPNKDNKDSSYAHAGRPVLTSLLHPLPLPSRCQLYWPLQASPTNSSLPGHRSTQVHCLVWSDLETKPSSVGSLLGSPGHPLPTGPLLFSTRVDPIVIPAPPCTASAYTHPASVPRPASTSGDQGIRVRGALRMLGSGQKHASRSSSQ
jgi:hypothetical protein